ncbi:MAG TPA: tyrosine-type recombinase/integrase [Rectinemataceae bacterium]|nr:tyrosine-type recombinase/integrase [Rectinemataceae bacterium]
MARNPVCVSKRTFGGKNQFRYYVRIWDEERGKYSTARSAQSLVFDLELDTKRYPPTSRTGALLIGQELARRGGKATHRDDPLLADYCAQVWDWETSTYIQGRIARGLRIGRQHAAACASYVKNYIRPAFPALTLKTLRPYHIETFILGLKKKGKLGNRSINAILDALSTPLKEAARLGLIEESPAATIRKLATVKREKGIPTEDELRALLSLSNIDPRVRASIILGAVCGLRLGEIQALKLENIEDTNLHIAHSWGKVDGLKGTKTGRVRVVPLPAIVADELHCLADSNIHGKDGFLIYGVLPKTPLDCRAIERGFDLALVRLSMGEAFDKATNAEKKAALAPWKARNITFHSLRHFANAQLRGAVPDETLRKLTGHTTEEMTDHYDHTTKADLKALAEAQATRILPFIKTA